MGCGASKRQSGRSDQVHPGRAVDKNFAQELDGSTLQAVSLRASDMSALSKSKMSDEVSLTTLHALADEVDTSAIHCSITARDVTAEGLAFANDATEQQTAVAAANPTDLPPPAITLDAIQEHDDEELQRSVQSDGFISASFIRDYPELAAQAVTEPSVASRFMTLVEGDGPTPQQMWAQLGSDFMMAHSSGTHLNANEADDSLTFS